MSPALPGRMLLMYPVLLYILYPYVTVLHGSAARATAYAPEGQTGIFFGLRPLQKREP